MLVLERAIRTFADYEAERGQVCIVHSEDHSPSALAGHSEGTSQAQSKLDEHSQRVDRTSLVDAYIGAGHALEMPLHHSGIAGTGELIAVRKRLAFGGHRGGIADGASAAD